MINIAICDDDFNFSNNLLNMFENISDQFNYKFNVQLFSKGEKLLDYLRSNPNIDILFLDINLITTNGVKIGTDIRDELGNYGVKIVYVSSEFCYSNQIFNTKPFGFLKKPIKEKELVKILKDYLLANNQDINDYYVFSIRGESYKIKTQDIIYFESNNRIINIYCNDIKYSFYGKLNEIESELKQKGFARIHQSYLVNIAKITKYKYNEAELTNSIKLNISKPYRKSTRDLIFEIRRKVSDVQ